MWGVHSPGNVLTMEDRGPVVQRCLVLFLDPDDPCFEQTVIKDAHSSSVMIRLAFWRVFYMFQGLHFAQDWVGLFWFRYASAHTFGASFKFRLMWKKRNDLRTDGNVILSGEPPGKRKLESGSNRRRGVSICVFCHSYEAHFIIVMTSALKHWTLGGGIPPHLKRLRPIFGEPAALNQLRSIDSGVGSSCFLISIAGY